MCGRYSFHPKPKQQPELEGLQPEFPELQLSLNIAPTHVAYVLTADSPATLQRMEWGLVPHWSADGKNSGKLINARAEGIEEKPSFREPVHSRRCLVPADSFYEWRHLPGGRKVPYRIFLNNGQLLWMAGIWDEWKRGGAVKHTFSIITTEPNREMSGLHNRMPVILADARARRAWLEGSMDDALSQLHPLADGQLEMYRVTDKLNKAGYEGSDVQDPVPEEGTLFE